MTTHNNLSQLEAFVSSLKRRLQRDYDRGVNKDLSKQQWQDLFIRNVTHVLKQALNESLAEIHQSATKLSSSEVLAVFDGFIDEFVQYALHKHRTSCALSNFPDEHKPSQDYIAATLQITQADWNQFQAEVAKVLT